MTKTQIVHDLRFLADWSHKSVDWIADTLPVARRDEDAAGLREWLVSLGRVASLLQTIAGEIDRRPALRIIEGGRKLHEPETPDPEANRLHRPKVTAEVT